MADNTTLKMNNSYAQESIIPLISHREIMNKEISNDGDSLLSMSDQNIRNHNFNNLLESDVSESNNNIAIPQAKRRMTESKSSIHDYLKEENNGETKNPQYDDHQNISLFRRALCKRVETSIQPTIMRDSDKSKKQAQRDDKTIQVDQISDLNFANSNTVELLKFLKSHKSLLLGRLQAVDNLITNIQEVPHKKESSEMKLYKCMKVNQCRKPRMIVRQNRQIRAQEGRVGSHSRQSTERTTARKKVTLKIKSIVNQKRPQTRAKSVRIKHMQKKKPPSNYSLDNVFF